MNTFWLKIAVLVLLIMTVIILASVFTSSEKSGLEAEPPPKDKSFYDQVEDDKKKFSAEPKPVDNQVQQSSEDQTPAKPTVLYFKPLSEIEEIEAERLFNVAVPGRSLGRLPRTGFKLMVDSCRHIIKRWPDSWYAYRAKQMLIDMPVRFRPRYEITQEELDLSRFYKPRPGTEPYTVEESH